MSKLKNRMRYLFPSFQRKEMISLRYKNRAPYLTDKIDPYFAQREKMANGDINHLWADKLWIKDEVKDIKEIKTPKTYFKFDKKGKIYEGSIPKNGKVILKHNVSAYSDSVKVVNVEDITANLLKTFYKDNYIKDIANARGWNMADHLAMKSTFFAEEYLEWVPKSYDYKVYTFKEGFTLALEAPNFIESETGIMAEAWTEDFKSTLHPGSMVFAKESALSKENKDIFKILMPIARKLYKKVGHFARMDFYYHNGQVYLGEVTPQPSVGFVFDGRKFKKAKVMCEITGNCETVFESFDDPLVKKHIMRYIDKWNDSFGASIK